MTSDPYQDALKAQGIDAAECETRLAAVQVFAKWAADQGMELSAVQKDDLYRYAQMLAADGSNTPETFDAVCDYLLWAGLRVQYIALVEITDCHNGMQKLADTIEKDHGAELRSRIFAEPFPPLGADEAARCAYTRRVTGRMEDMLTRQQARDAWYQVQHGISEAYWQKQDARERQTFANCETVDSFLENKQRERVAMLRRVKEQNELWFTMELTDEVFAFLTEEPHMQWGSHNGRKGIVITKVPYRPAQYLHAEDSRMKRYYACHCPLVREAILRGEPVSQEVCYCSLGHASHFLAGLNLPHTGEVLQSAVMGDDRCRFIFYLPDEAEELEARTNPQ